MRLRRIMYRSFAVNALLIVVKIISGFLFNSIALVADGVHSISDLLSDVFVILGISHSFKPADDDHPFGHGKFEYVLSLILGISVITIAYNLGKRVIMTFNDPIQIPGQITLLVVAFVIVVKLLIARYLIRKGKEENSEIIRASGMESFSDMISSGVVFLGIIFVYIGQYFDIIWLQKGDRVASLLIALFIVRIGLMIILEAIHSLQGKSVSKKICEKYQVLIEDVPGVRNVDHLDMIAYGPYFQAIVDIRVDGTLSVKEGHDIAHNVHELLQNQEKICHVSVHVNPGGEE
ncbi:MAG: cation diffusion facilitator family transporter [Candidatus Izemoplasma sp.]|nr:cation diffusion facilitator family transporter [Candidatus Izemoplasma sp.]